MCDLVSFLVARDPSILAYNRGQLPKIKIQFDSLMESDDNSSASSSSSENKENQKEEDNKFLKVYLRIKGDSEEYKDIYEVNKNSLTCKKSDIIKKNYTFSKIFGPEVNQTEIFNYTAKSKLLSFINGKNSSLLTYGASGSGKTYTIVGTPEEPGLIPRSLEYIFGSITVEQKTPQITPLPDGFVKEIDPQMLFKLESKKAFIIKAIHIDQAAHIKTYKQMQARLSSEPIAEVEYKANASVSVWVCFSEIYNETLYDLLVPHVSKGIARPKLELGKTRDDNTYIKNLTILNVSNGLEAYQILQYGLQNLNYAATAINSHSSRSHCIFTIKLVQSSKNSDEVFISNFSFCDLAGSERLKKTLNLGDRLKESNKINTSLLVLGRCMENIKKCQQIKDRRLIPFRESKLTQLFQKALMGFERLEMIVNINPSRNMYDETIHVLNFSAIAKQIIIEEQLPKVARKRTRFSLLLENKEKDQRGNNCLKVNNVESTLFPKEKQRKKSYNSLNEEYHQLLLEKDSLIEYYEEQIDLEKDRVIEIYKDLLDKRQKRHNDELMRLKEEYERKCANVISISSDESDSEEEEDADEWEENKKNFKSYSRKELIKHIMTLEETLKEATEEGLYLRSEIERYREIYRNSVMQYAKEVEGCENVVFSQ
ncbi:unnamed protein product [Psylliodes chrysocephalus]|uniref:Kinesin motor domain-containing protein n=1 Tax=Psylliodes chrysocephalus TaxID=3402493 RepID=A0A9P0D290_9CUCU|nr:unnamed protein product [Psylliodes chrysocephala]